MVSADYIVGLTDGEGCFYINIRPKDKLKWGNSVVETHFYIKLREDHLSLLEEVKQRFGCGAIYFQKEKRVNHNSCYRFEINSQKDIHETLIPFFNKYLLHGPKKTSFFFFKKIAMLVKSKKHLSEEGLNNIRFLKEKMNHRARPMREIRSSGGNGKLA
ncbi:MAG: LAGLIDADG family homing endonuclease [bacterium]|nr:LAGLIDADG family homing endonuclease [bacterium]